MFVIGQQRIVGPELAADIVGMMDADIEVTIIADPRRQVLLICNTQNRSSAVQRALKERGYHHVQYVNGGMSEWARRGWPMVKPGSPK